MEQHGMDIDTDDDGWYFATCDCGWVGMPCPGQGEASDDWADHIRDEAGR